MKNKIALYVSVIALCACFATPAVSDTTVSCTTTCDGGKCFTGAVDGHEFCRSSSTMTWWAAFAWCERQGRTLATVEQICGDTRGGTSCENAINTQSSVTAWTANPSGSNGAFLVSLSSGAINHRYGRTATTQRCVFRRPLLLNKPLARGVLKPLWGVIQHL